MNQTETTEIPEGWGRIYALADPRNPKLPVYVGRTANTLRARLWDHSGEAKKKKNINRPVSVWVRGIRAEGLVPTIYTLETAPFENLKARENYWIVFFRPLGTLLNVHDGDGELGEPRKMSERVRAITAPHLKSANEKRKKRLVDERGLVCDSLAEASAFIGVSENRLKENLAKGWPINGHKWRYIENESVLNYEP